MKSTDIFIISYHDARDSYDGGRRNYQPRDFIQSELRSGRFDTIEEAAKHIAKLNSYQDRNEPSWVHHIVWSELFNDELLDEGWSVRFSQTLYADFLDDSLPDVLREAVEAEAGRIEAERATAKIMAEAEANARRVAEEVKAAAAAAKATENKEYADYLRLKAKFEKESDSVNRI